MIVKKHTISAEKAKPRQIGDAPSIGFVPRAATDVPKGRKKRSSRSTRRKRLSKNFFTWSAVVCFVAACVLVVCLVRYSRNKKTRDLNTATAAGKLGAYDQILEKEGVTSVPDLESDHATRIVNQALTNRDTGLIRDFFILAKDDKPEQAMKEMLRINDAEGDISRMEWRGLMSANGSTVPQVMIYATKDGKKYFRTAQFAKSSDGRWRIDFDAYLRKCVPPLSDVVTAESGTSQVRVYVDEDHYYHGIYSDETKWKVYALTSPDIAENLYAYAKRGSSQDKALRRIIDTDEKIHRATLGIVKQTDSGPRQFEILRVIAENWIIGGEDFDKSF